MVYGVSFDLGRVAVVHVGTFGSLIDLFFVLIDFSWLQVALEELSPRLNIASGSFHAPYTHMQRSGPTPPPRPRQRPRGDTPGRTCEQGILEVVTVRSEGGGSQAGALCLLNMGQTRRFGFVGPQLALFIKRRWPWPATVKTRKLVP